MANCSISSLFCFLSVSCIVSKSDMTLSILKVAVRSLMTSYSVSKVSSLFPKSYCRARLNMTWMLSAAKDGIVILRKLSMDSIVLYPRMLSWYCSKSDKLTWGMGRTISHYQSRGRYRILAWGGGLLMNINEIYYCLLPIPISNYSQLYHGPNRKTCMQRYLQWLTKCT